MKLTTWLFALAALVSSGATGKELAIPAPYVLDAREENGCRYMHHPRKNVGAEVCLQNLSLEVAATQFGMFEQDGGKWILSGAGIPNLAKQKKICQVSYLYGESFCAIEDMAGSHGAGAKCFFGIASRGESTFIFRSKPVKLDAWNVFEKQTLATMFFSTAKLNFGKTDLLK